MIAIEYDLDPPDGDEDYKGNVGELEEGGAMHVVACSSTCKWLNHLPPFPVPTHPHFP